MPTLLTGEPQKPQPKKPIGTQPAGTVLTSDYQKSPEFTPTPTDIPLFQSWQPTGPTAAPGMVQAGNIDLTKRPLVHHPDGSVSTLYSASFSTPKGEVLVPLVSPEGKMLTPQQGIDLYKKTGKHLGIFATPQAADAFAIMLHQKQGAFQTWKNGGKFSPSAETWDNWKPK